VRARANFCWAPDLPRDGGLLETGEAPGPVLRAVEGDRYVVTKVGGGFVGATLWTPEKVTDFVFEVHVTKLAGPDGCAVCVNYGQWWPRDHYGFWCSEEWGTPISRVLEGERTVLPAQGGVPQVNLGDEGVTLKVVRRGAAIHVFINGSRVASAEDFTIRLGMFGLVFGPGEEMLGERIQVAFSGLRIEGVDLDLALNKAREHRSRFEEREVRQLFDHADRHWPGYVREDFADLAVTRPDRRDTVLVVVGSAFWDQVASRGAAARLREEINKRGAGHATRWAMVVTDTGALADELAMSFPLISLCVPESNQVTARIAAESARDPTTPRWLHAHHNLEKAGKRLAIWQPGQADPARAVERLISSGLLDRFLEVVWAEG